MAEHVLEVRRERQPPPLVIVSAVPLTGLIGGCAEPLRSAWYLMGTEEQSRSQWKWG